MEENTLTESIKEIAKRKDRQVQQAQKEPGTDIATVENDIRRLVQDLRDKASPDTLPSRIGDHTKGILGHCVGVTKENINQLRKALDELESMILENEARLFEEVDQHIKMSEQASSATQVIGDTIKQWRREISGQNNLNRGNGKGST